MPPRGPVHLMRDAISLQSMSAPAASRPCASATTSGHSDPPSTKSSIESRNMMMNLGSTAARIRSTIARGRRVRFVYVPNEGGNQRQSVAISRRQWQSPPHSSVRHQWQSVAISGHQWQSVVMSGNYPPTRPCAISGNQWQSVVISGNYLPTRPSACSYAPR